MRDINAYWILAQREYNPVSRKKMIIVNVCWKDLKYRIFNLDNIAVDLII